MFEPFIIIMGIPPRIDLANNLIDILGKEAQKRLILSIDPYFDSKKPKIWRHFLHCLKMFDKNYTHLIMLPDDFIVCKDFYETCKRIISLRPNNIINFMADESTFSRAIKNNCSWLRYDVSHVGAASILPREIVKRLINFSKYVYEDARHDDGVVSIFTEYYGVKTFIPVPTLVQHVGQKRSSKSTVHYKKFEYFIGENESGLSIDFSKCLNSPISRRGERSSFSYLKPGTHIYKFFKDKYPNDSDWNENKV